MTFCCEDYAKLVAQSNEIIDIIGADAYTERLDEWTMDDYRDDELSQIRREMVRHRSICMDIPPMILPGGAELLPEKPPEEDDIPSELLKTVEAAGNEKIAQFIREELL